VGEVFHGSRRGQSVQPEFLKIAKDALKHGPITRATALLELTAIGAQVDHRDLSELIQDPDPMVRRHAAPLLTRRSDLKALLNDPVRSVRLDALRQVMSPAGRISPEGWEAELKARWPDVLGMLDANADQAGAHVLKAQVHQALGEMEQAMASFQTGIEVQPELTGARTQLAQIHADAGREKEALALWKDEIAAIETTLELVTDEPSLWYQLGLLQYRCKLERDTIRSMKVVLKLQPNHYNAGAFVIQLSQRLQRWRDVKDAAKTLLNHFPQDQWLQQTFMDASRR
jgi:tetratricopeptide (TPR) repeat protein